MSRQADRTQQRRHEILVIGDGLVTECGVRLWFIVHCLDELKGRYPDGWQTLIANTGVMTVWRNFDQATLGFISERTGLTVLELERLLATDTQC